MAGRHLPQRGGLAHEGHRRQVRLQAQQTRRAQLRGHRLHQAASIRALVLAVVHRHRLLPAQRQQGGWRSARGSDATLSGWWPPPHCMLSEQNGVHLSNHSHSARVNSWDGRCVSTGNAYSVINYQQLFNALGIATNPQHCVMVPLYPSLYPYFRIGFRMRDYRYACTLSIIL